MISSRVLEQPGIAAKYCNGERPSRWQLLHYQTEHLPAHFNHKSHNLATLLPHHKNIIFLERGCCVLCTGLGLKHVKRLMWHEGEFD